MERSQAQTWGSGRPQTVHESQQRHQFFTATASVVQLKALVYATQPKIHVQHQRLSFGDRVLEDGRSLADYNISHDSDLKRTLLLQSHAQSAALVHLKLHMRHRHRQLAHLHRLSLKLKALPVHLDLMRLTRK